MKKLLTLILTLFATPCFADPDNLSLMMVNNSGDVDRQLKYCKQGDLLSMYSAEPTSHINTDFFQRFTRSYCNFDYSVVITSNNPALSCVFRENGRQVRQIH